MYQNGKSNVSIVLLVTLVFLFAFALLYFRQSLFDADFILTKKETILSETTTLYPSSAKTELPLRILIPSIHVDAAIQQVGLTPQGAMEVPSDATDTGWYKLGSIPGEHGSAVIAGHYDGENGTKGVFENLHLLKRGDKIYIKVSSRKTKSFIVRESRMYDPKADASAVFNQSDGSYLNLITCDGQWDDFQKSYSKRLVVFTELSTSGIE